MVVIILNNKINLFEKGTSIGTDKLRTQNTVIKVKTSSAILSSPILEGAG